MKRVTAPTMRRADADIFAEARQALDRQPSIPATVRVHVDKGIATLTGTVRLASQSAEAEQTVRRVRGVEGVVNEVDVALGPSAAGFEAPDRLE